MKEPSEMLGVAPESGVDKGAILGLIVGEWCSMRIKPHHWGEYEVRFRGDTAVKRIRYDHEGWDLRAVGASGWRGQVMETLLSSSDRGKAEELWHRKALAAYLGNDPGTHAAAVEVHST